MVTELCAGKQIDYIHIQQWLITRAKTTHGITSDSEKVSSDAEWRNSQMAPNTMDVLGFASILRLSDATRWKLFISNRLREILICDQILIHLWCAFVGRAAWSCVQDTQIPIVSYHTHLVCASARYNNHLITLNVYVLRAEFSYTKNCSFVSSIAFGDFDDAENSNNEKINKTKIRIKF